MFYSNLGNKLRHISDKFSDLGIINVLPALIISYCFEKPKKNKFFETIWVETTTRFATLTCVYLLLKISSTYFTVNLFIYYLLLKLKPAWSRQVSIFALVLVHIQPYYNIICTLLSQICSPF